MSERNPWGRLIMPALRLDRVPLPGVRDEAFRLLDEIQPGGFILFGGQADDVAALTRELSRRSPHPLLFGADLERGAGQQFSGLTTLPSLAAIAAAPEAASLACLAGRQTAVEARSVGVQLIFAPVADVNTESRNPIINVRSFGSDPARVATLVRHWIYGAQAAGALACAKHFPGHGDTTVDSHAGLPVGVADPALFETVHLEPFRAAIASGVKALMVAHMTAPVVDDSGLPATLSKAVVTGLLRDRLRFPGLVVTDALIMSGIGRPEAEAAVMAVEAGCDILLYPESPAAVLDRLASSSLDPAPALARIGKSLANDLAATIARNCVTILSGEPARPSSFHVVLDDDRLDPAPFVAAARAAGLEEVDEQRAREIGASCLLAVYAMPGAWRGRSGLAEDRLAALPRGTGLVSFGDPYLCERVETAYAIAAYDAHPATQEAVIDVLTGREPARGRFPL